MDNSCCFAVFCHCSQISAWDWKWGHFHMKYLFLVCFSWLTAQQNKNLAYLIIIWNLLLIQPAYWSSSDQWIHERNCIKCVYLCMCVCLCLCESGNPALQSQYSFLYPMFVYNAASQVMERAGEGDGQRDGGRERKRDCEWWYQWNLFVCTL